MVEAKTSSDQIEVTECENCGSNVKLADPNVNRCSNCGVEYDGHGLLITKEITCEWLECNIYLVNKERNVCNCGLAYDGDGNPISTTQPKGTYIGRQWAGADNLNPGDEYYYAYSNGDGTWTLYRHWKHPDANQEDGPYSANGLVEALKEFGFKLEEILEKNVEGLNAALKKQ